MQYTSNSERPSFQSHWIRGSPTIAETDGEATSCKLKVVLTIRGRKLDLAEPCGRFMRYRDYNAETAELIRVLRDPSPSVSLCSKVSCQMSHLQIEAAIQRIFCNPSIMAGEDPADYRRLKGSVITHVNPQDLQEVLLTRDIVDAEWEYRRLRGLKPGIVHAAFPRAVKSQIGDAGDAGTFETESIPAIRKHVSGMVAGDAQARPELEQMLEHHKLTVDIIAASAFADTIVAQVHTDRMAAAAYQRRKAAYAELEHLRARKQSKGQTIAMPHTDREGEFDPPANADVVAGNIGEPTDGSAKLSNGR